MSRVFQESSQLMSHMCVAWAVNTRVLQGQAQTQKKDAEGRTFARIYSRMTGELGGDLMIGARWSSLCDMRETGGIFRYPRSCIENTGEKSYPTNSLHRSGTQQ